MFRFIRNTVSESLSIWTPTSLSSFTAITAQENRELVRRFIREANRQEYEEDVALLTDDYRRHDPDASVEERGTEPFVEALRGLHEAFPDSTVHVGEMVADDDMVAFEGTMTGTHEGVFRGVEHNQEPFEIPGTAMHRIRDGKNAETWATWNFLVAFQQLGVIDEPPG